MEKIGAVLSPARVLTIQEVADSMKISPWLAGELARRGELRSIKIGRRRVIPCEALDEYIAQASARGKAS